MLMHIKLAGILILGLPLLAGVNLAPQTASAFLMGAWAGVLLAAPPLMILAFCMGLYDLRQLLAPLMRLPVLIVVTIAVLFFSGVDVGLGLQSLAAGIALWWARKGRFLLGL